MERYRVQRMNRDLGLAETVRGLSFHAARRLVERDLATGTCTTMELESHVRDSGRRVA